MGRKARSKRKRRKLQDDDLIIPGESERGDFVLELTQYIKAYEEDFKVHPFEGLSKLRREIVLENLMLLRSANELPLLHEDPQGFLNVAKSITDAERNNPNTDLMATPSIENIKDKMIDGSGKTAEEILKENIKDISATATTLGGIEKTVKSSRRYVLDHYLMLNNVLTNPNIKDKGVGPLEKESKNMLWGRLREARIFEIPVSLFATLYHESDLFVCKEAGVEYTMPGERDIPPKEMEHYLKVSRSLREGWQLPEHMPFECLYFGINGSVLLTETQQDSLNIPERVTRCSWMGYLVTSKWVFVLVRTGHREDPGIYAAAEMKNGKWQPDLITATPFIVNWLIEWVNDHQTCVQEGTSSFGYRHDYKKICKRWKIKKPIPAPYYTVYIKDELIDQEAWLRKLRKRQSMRPRRSPQHQYDVRGSWVCRITRGPLPLDPKLEKQLRRDRRRKIFTHERPDADTAQHLLKRGISPKRVDEWIAVLLYWRTDHRRGPEDGPHIPSIRKSARKRLKAVGE
jgi:hypothetical protein